MEQEERRDAWLMVIDMQVAFSRPESRWHVRDYAHTRDKIRELLPLFGERVIYTRFVSPEQEHGSWASYYERWPEFSRAGKSSSSSMGDSAWDIDMGGVQIHHMLEAPTFSKWMPGQLPQAMADTYEVYLAGVTLECCVLATALAAVDDGMKVHVIDDAVSASSDALRQSALSILCSRKGQVCFTQVPQLRIDVGSIP